MSDPRKNFICLECGAIFSDKQREWGNQTICSVCREKIKHAQKDKEDNQDVKKNENGDTINFNGIYNPEEDSPAVKVLIENWKRDLVERVVQRVMDKMKEKEK